MSWLLALLLLPGAALAYGLWESNRAKRKMRRLNNNMNSLEKYDVRFPHAQDAGDAQDR